MEVDTYFLSHVKTQQAVSVETPDCRLPYKCSFLSHELESNRRELQPESVCSVHFPNKKKDLILWCDIYIPSGWMFNLLRLHDTILKVTDTWNFNGRCGSENTAHIKTQALSIYSVFTRLRFTRSLVNPLRPITSCQELSTLQLLHLYLFNCLSWRKCIHYC